MADPNIELDEGLNMDRGQFVGPSAQPGSPPPPETQGEQPALESRAASGGALPIGVTGDLKAAFGRMNRPVLPPRSEVQAKVSPDTGLSKAIDSRQKGLQPHPIAAKRQHADIGRPPPDSVEPPHPANVPNIFHSIGQWFGQTNIGSAMTQMMGGRMAQESDAYIFAKQKSQLNEQAIRYNNMRNASLDTQTQLETELIDYARAMGGDPKTLTQRLLEVARQHGDTNLPFIVTHKGAQAGLDYLTELDRRYQDLHKSNTTLKGVEEEQNADPEGALAPDQRKKQGPQGTSDTAEPDGGNPYRTGGRPAETAPAGGPDTGGGAPTQKPPTGPAPAPEAPGGTTVVVPGAANAPSDQGGFTPNMGDTGPQGEAGPLPAAQGVQVAEAGASDLPPVWLNKVADITSTPTGEAAAAITAQQDDGYDHPMPASDVFRNARYLKSGSPYRATDLIDQAAREEIWNPGSIDKLKKLGLGSRAANAEKRLLEITDYLSSLTHDPHKPGPWLVRDIEKAVPGLGQLVDQVAKGQKAPPMDRQQYGRDPFPKLVSMLVGKLDPNMVSQQAYQGRYKNLMDYGPHGTQGKYVMSNVTAFSHVDDAMKIIREIQTIPGWQQTLSATAQSLPSVSVLGPLLRRPSEWAAGKIGGAQGQRMEQLLGALALNLDIAVAETQRAASGAAPHEAGMDRLLSTMDITKNDPSEAIAAGEQAIKILSHRLQVSADTFKASTGAGYQQNLFNYMKSYLSKSGAATSADNPFGPEMLSPETRQLLGGGSIAPGEVEDGYRFRGGDPGDQRNWDRVQ